MELRIGERVYTCERTAPTCFTLTRRGEPPIRVQPSPAKDGTWRCSRVHFLALHVDAFGALSVGPPKAA